VLIAFYFCLGLAVILWVAFTIEAFRGSILQGILALICPFYVWYYAFLHSRFGAPARFALVLASAGVILF
tara:strand:+ start:180 stop:389 length:210 start_codon:yes stop_codon:yes gene_type:complete